MCRGRPTSRPAMTAAASRCRVAEAGSEKCPVRLRRAGCTDEAPEDPGQTRRNFAAMPLTIPWSGRGFAVTRRQVCAGTFGLIIVFKVCLVVAYGPIFVPDSGGYVGYASQILTSNAWLHDAQSSAIRTFGYPVILAAAMLAGGALWPYLIVGLQFTVTTGTLWAIHRLGLELKLSWWLSLAAVVAFATSDQLVMDQCILTDSLNADIVILAVCILARGAASGEPLSLRAAASAGALLAIAFLLREAMPFLATTLLPLIGLRWWSSRRNAPIGSLVSCALVLLPLMGTMEAYKGWNAYRTGQRFVTTSAMVNLTFALIVAAQQDHAVFDGDTPLDVAARRRVRNYVYEEVAAVNAELLDQGFRATEITSMSWAHYLATWRQRPWAMLHVLRRHTSENVAKLAFRPMAATCTVVAWATGERRCPDYRDLLRAARSGFVHDSLAHAVFFVFQTLELTLSIAVFSAFLVGAPVMLVASCRNRGARVGERECLVLALWAMYVGWFVIYGAVHLEDRYMVPVVPFSILGGLVVHDEWRRGSHRAVAR